LCLILQLFFQKNNDEQQVRQTETCSPERTRKRKYKIIRSLLDKGLKIFYDEIGNTVTDALMTDTVNTCETSANFYRAAQRNKTEDSQPYKLTYHFRKRSKSYYILHTGRD
jgi:hypothetical protein